MTAQRDVEESRSALRDVLKRAEDWLRAASGLPHASSADLRHDAEAVKRLSTRAASSLINVALLGAFSSGKSFLLSGLQGGLELVEVPTADGETASKFVGLLPSSPVPTTACPASVVPVEDHTAVDASGTGFMRVRFTDSRENEWEDIGNSVAPSVVAAYAMQDANVTDRLREHRGREIAEIEILLAGSKLPAKFYDLPGYGSPVRAHNDIVKAAMADADCFMYVSHASRTLSDSDLDLIRFLYDHYLMSKKPVVWVVTAIDRASNLDIHNQVEWKATIARNDAYLKENFKLQNGQPDMAFIGNGFIPVSPALEARADKHALDGNSKAEIRCRADSRMEVLREEIEELISTGAGARHIAAVASEARVLLAPRQQALTDRLRTERLPIDSLKEMLGDLHRQLSLLDEELPRLRADLEQALRNRVDRAARPFNRLAAHLHTVLDPAIRETDLNKPTRANQIQVRKTQTLHAWMESPTGPATLWSEQFDAFKQDVVRAVDGAFGSREIASGLPDFTFDVDDLSLPQQVQRRRTAQDLVQRAAAFVGIATPFAAGGSWLGGLFAAGSVFPPATFVAGAAALVVAGIQYRKRKSSSLEVLQGEWINAIDGEAAAVRDQFALATSTQGMTVIDHLEDNLLQHRVQLEQSRDLYRERVARPEYQGRQELVDRLEPVCAEGQVLVEALRELGRLP